MTATDSAATQQREATDGTGVLSALYALDLSDGVAGQFAARILADYGARTDLIEPAAGCSVRRLGPFDRKRAPPEDSLLFFHLNAGKGSLRVEVQSSAGRAALERLVADADVIFTGDAALAAELASRHPRLVACVVTDFAAGGPYSNWKDSELVHQALGGLMFMTGREGEEPLYGFGHRAYYSAGAAAAAATLAAIYERETSGRGQVVSVTVNETAVAMSQHVVSQYSYNGSFPVRGVYPTGGVDTFRCADGWVVLYCRSDRWAAFCSAMGADAIGHAPDFVPALYAKNWLEARRQLSPYLAVLPCAEVVARAHHARVIVAKVMSMVDVLACEHFAARKFWDTTTRGERILGPLFRLHPADRRVIGPAPRLDAALPPDLSAETGDTPRTPAPQSERRAPPLAGIRVMEMTTAWAGPMLCRILAHLGAEVVKVETSAAMDVFRGNASGGSKTQYPQGDAGARPYNRAVAFNTQNLGKRSLNLDLKAAPAKEIAQRLVKQSDIVVCNFSPRAMRGLKLDYASLKDAREDIILIELPAAGSGGPLADIAGVGHTMEALAGMTGLQGYPEGTPQRTGPAYLDPIAAFNGTIAVLLALYDRQRTGRGRRIELAQIEASMQWLGEWLLLCERTGEFPAPNGNQRPDAAPHGAFRTSGDDAWIAIGVFAEPEWIELCAELSAAELGADARFDSLSKRAANAGDLRIEIERRTRTRDKHELAAALQKRGVRAAPVCSGKDIHDDAHLAQTNFFLHLDHPEAGRHRFHGLPFHFSECESSAATHAPLLGEHTALVLRGLGIDGDRLESLQQDGVAVQAPGA